jgi:hypothetical protein
LAGPPSARQTAKGKRKKVKVSGQSSVAGGRWSEKSFFGPPQPVRVRFDSAAMIDNLL